jgi:hypothetical protein
MVSAEALGQQRETPTLKGSNIKAQGRGSAPWVIGMRGSRP